MYIYYLYIPLFALGQGTRVIVAMFQAEVKAPLTTAAKCILHLTQAEIRARAQCAQKVKEEPNEKGRPMSQTSLSKKLGHLSHAFVWKDSHDLHDSLL